MKDKIKNSDGTYDIMPHEIAAINGHKAISSLLLKHPAYRPDTSGQSAYRFFNNQPPVNTANDPETDINQPSRNP